MAESSEGWDGTIDEAGMARILDAAVPGRVGGPGDFSASVVSGLRRVLLTPGKSHQAFIRYTDTSPRTIDLAAPTAGRWHLIVQRRNWSNNTVTTVALLGSTTSAAIPTATPSALPASFSANPGVIADLPLWWAWVNNADNSIILRDARTYDSGLERIDAPRFEGRIRRSDGQLAINAGQTLMKWQGTPTNTIDAVATSNAAGAILVLPAGGIYCVTTSMKLQCGVPNWSYMFMTSTGGVVLGSSGYERQTPSGFYDLEYTQFVDAVDELTMAVFVQSNNAGVIREDGIVRAFQVR